MTSVDTLPDPAVEMFDALLTAKGHSGKTYGQLAKRATVSRSLVHHYFSGLRWPPLSIYLELIYRMGEDPLQESWVGLYRKAVESVGRSAEPVELLEEKLSSVINIGKKPRYVPMSERQQSANAITLRSAKAIIVAFVVFGVAAGAVIEFTSKDEVINQRTGRDGQVCNNTVMCGDPDDGLGADSPGGTRLPLEPTAVVKPKKVAAVYPRVPLAGSLATPMGRLPAGTKVYVMHCYKEASGSWAAILYKEYYEGYVDLNLLQSLDSSSVCPQ